MGRKQYFEQGNDEARKSKAPKPQPCDHPPPLLTYEHNGAWRQMCVHCGAGGAS